MHTVWHLLILAFVLVGTAGVALVVLAPLLFETPPDDLERARPFIVAVAVAGAILVAVDWLVVHRRFL